MKAGLVFLVLAILFFVAACGPDPTPTPGPTPTRTRRATRTPFPTLTPRVLPSPTAAPISAVVTDTLRVRAQPNTDARILGRLQKDATVMLLSRSDDNQWFLIEYPPASGQVGWIFGEVVIPGGDVATLPIGALAPEPPPGSIFAIVRTEGDPLRMRAGPGTNYEVLARIPDTTRLLLTSKLPDGSWYQSSFPPNSGQFGWVSGDFLTLEGSADVMQVAQAPATPTPGPTAVPRPTRAPQIAEGGSILVSTRRGGADDISSIGENGILRRQLTSSGDASGARYSPSGEQIVFTRAVVTAPSPGTHIYLMDFDGSNVTDLSARAGGGYSDSAPDWSPDGQRIVFVRTPRAGAPELWTMSANGSNATRLLRLSSATGTTDEYSPSPRWSPDGGRIAYAAVPRTEIPGVPLYPAIFVVQSNGTGERQLTDNDLINTGPLWSPDGSQIVWNAKDFLNRQNWRTWIMNASGSDQRIFLTPPGGDGNNGIQAVVWRENRVLAAGWTGNWNTYLVDAGGSNLTQVTRDATDDVPSDWLP